MEGLPRHIVKGKNVREQHEKTNVYKYIAFIYIYSAKRP